MKTTVLIITCVLTFMQFGTAQTKEAKVTTAISNELKHARSVKDLAAVWELKKMVSPNGDTINTNSVGYLKMYQQDQSFQILKPSRKGFFVALTGTYELPSKGKLVEKVIDNSGVPGTENIDNKEPMDYSISADRKFMTLKYKFKTPSGEMITTTEIWQRVTHDVPTE